MNLPKSLERMDLATRVLVAGRAVVLVLMLAFHIPMGAGEFTHSAALSVGVTLYATWSIIWIVHCFMRPTSNHVTMLTVSAVIDGVGLALLVAATSQYRDPFFAWYVAEATVFGLMLRRRRAWVLGGVLTASYLFGHLFGGLLADPIEAVFVLVNAGALMGVGVAVSLALRGQEQRQAQVESQRSEVVNLNERLERSVAELRAVTEITERIHSTLEVESVGPVLLDILEKVINIPAGSLYVIDKAKQETIFSTSSVAAAASRSYSGLELAGALPVGSPDGALSCMELVDHNQTVVVFCADSAAIDGLSSDDRIVLQAVASELVVAVENSRLYRLTKRLAITDELTDLYNYRFLQQRLDDEMGRADRYSKRLSLLMLDIDDFKRINDTYGHLVGDLVLSEVGLVLKSTVREVDIVARYGGEEFTIILPETDASGAFIVAEKIRETIAMHRFPDAEGGHSIHLTVSIGLSSYPVHAADKESLLRSADDAVYHAKETGKDRVRAPRLRLRRMPAADPLEEAAE
ncbi:MAG: GGDEF domain-containing protein [Coriobacteriia bacterium]|nr:GGDEF domain-containing protein [Coriobacteriia bacterium]